MTNREAAPVLEVEGLHVSFPYDRPSHAAGRTLRAVRDVSLTLRAGRTLGLIGESGCGKTMTAQAILGLVPAPGRVRARRLTLCHPSGDDAGTDLSSLDREGEQMRRVRGGQISMVFQDAASSLSPVRTVGGQLRETIMLHRQMHRREADQVAVELLERVGMPDPAECLRQDAASSRIMLASLPASAVRRDEPARGDCAGALRCPEGPDRGRTDYRARPRAAAPGCQSDPPTADGLRTGGALHHTRPRSGRGGLRRDRRHVPGSNRGSRNRAWNPQPTTPPLHSTVASVGAAARSASRTFADRARSCAESGRSCG